MYKVEKVNIETEETLDYGTMIDYREVIPKNYTFNGLFWERKNSKYIYIAEVVRAIEF